MKKISSTIILSILLFACKSTEEVKPVEKTLVGTRWSSFSFKSVVDGSSVYKMLVFINNTEVEYYSATEKTKLVGTKEILTYTYVHPKLTVSRTTTVNNNKPFTSEGSVYDTFLTVIGADYTKE